MREVDELRKGKKMKKEGELRKEKKIRKSEDMGKKVSEGLPREESGK